jgi:hypothetical protein
MRTLGRIDGHLRTAMDADPRAKASMTATRENARLLLLSVMQKALWNVLDYTKDSSPEKLRAIDGRLEATSEADLRTVDGCLEVFALFEEASPRFKQYGPTLEIYMLQEQGEIPRRATRK